MSPQLPSHNTDDEEAGSDTLETPARPRRVRRVRRRSVTRRHGVAPSATAAPGPDSTSNVSRSPSYRSTNTSRVLVRQSPASSGVSLMPDSPSLAPQSSRKRGSSDESAPHRTKKSRIECEEMPALLGQIHDSLFFTPRRSRPLHSQMCPSPSPTYTRPMPSSRCVA